MDERTEKIKQRIERLQCSIDELNWILDTLSNDKFEKGYLITKTIKRKSAFMYQIQADKIMLEEEE